MIDNASRWFESLPVRGKLVVTVSVQLVVLTLGCLSFLLAQRELAQARAWTNHTHLVIELAEALRAEAIAQQTGIRGFVLSGRRAYLEPYTEGVQQFETLSSQLYGLLEDNARQQGRLRRVEDLMRAWQEQVATPRLQGAAAIASDMGADGIDVDKRLIDAIKELCAEVIGQERSFLAEREAELVRREKFALALTLGLLLVGWFTGLRAVRTLHRVLGQPLSELAALAPRLAGKDPVSVPFGHRGDEVGVMSAALERLRTASVEQGRREWVAEQSARILSALQGCSSESEFSETLLARLCGVLDAGYGLAYRWNEDSALLEWIGAYGLPDMAATQRRFRLGEGLVGQTIVERRAIELTPVPEGYLRVVSALGASLPHALALFPLTARGQAVAVIELGLLRDLRPQDRALVDEVLVTTGLAWYSLSRSLKTRELLAESQARTEALHASEEALRTQQDKLRAVNEALRARSTELEEQGRRLSLSEREMREQSRELRRANEMLEEQTRALSQRQKELELARFELERKAADLERASRYKSEFLANMSHELRTPLNSMLILSRLLADNAQGHLNAEEVESARIVHDSGQSLLGLINDILDLSKVEAGKLQLSLEDVNIRDCLRVLAARYRPLATQRDLEFVVQVQEDVPAQIHSDGARLSQILGNLLSNALKFTHRGGVTLSASRDGEHLRLSVRDTGIGIAQDKLERVFEAFEQADSGTARRYGGTGLGLSIVSGMASLLGGEVKV
ncbi:CHASE3 domain-containing protein [Panacagrimonas sp.]|uniref:CHASE3 domain-containing protein n=1 Tax=Panacagrimonas sp. TaxID=2480088 RepID=UPI003B51F768